MSADDSRNVLPAAVNEYVIEYPAATPATIMDALDLDDETRGQLEYFCAVTRYTQYAERNDCEKAVDLRVQTVEWSDIAEWDVPVAALPPDDRPSEE
jgi:hypothetical protein